MGRSTPPQINVVAGIIINDDAQVLIAKRPQHLDQGGLWEFPGGKREQQESSTQALARELDEELGIVIESALPTLALSHEYPKKIVNLEFFEVTKWQGQAWGKEGQSIRWVAKNQLEQFSFPAANLSVISTLRFSRVALCVSAPSVSIELLRKLEHCLALGFTTIAVTDTRLPQAQHEQCKQVYQLCERYGGQLLLDCKPGVLANFPDAGLLAKPVRSTKRPILNEQLFVCECESFDDLLRVKSLNPDAVFLSLESIVSRQDSEQMPRLREITKQLNFPVMALTDMSVDALYKAINLGCYGIAVSVNNWDDTTYDNIDSYFEEITTALGSLASGS